MQLLTLSHLLLSSLFASTTSASPLWRHVAQQVLSTLSPQARPATQELYKPSSYLDVRPNAVVLALSAAGDEMARYFFLPLGENVLTHNIPEIPLHPVSAHVVGAVDGKGMVVQSQGLSDIECAIYPAWNRTLNPGKRIEDFAIRIAPQDGVVDLTAGQQPAWLGGREVEAYECW